MGNEISSAKKEDNKLKPKSLFQILDYISSQYILTMDFQSLKRLYEKEYCDKLVILTSDIIERYFTDIEITYLAQRIKQGAEVNELVKDKIIFFEKDKLNNLNVQSSLKKKRICIGIAKFYIKIAHLFAAIVTTINPIYIYKDSEGNTVKAKLFEKGKIPINVPRQIIKTNICQSRINSLKGFQKGGTDSQDEVIENEDKHIDLLIDEMSNNSETVTNKTFLPNFCTMNLDENGSVKSLIDEPGIPELMDLYLDDKYDYETGKFTGMSDKTKRIFDEDLSIFYQVFTGEPNMPSNIRSFKDIKLRTFQSKPYCVGKEMSPLVKQKLKDGRNSSLFYEYAENLKQMIRRSNNNQELLLGVLNKIFVYIIDPQTNKKQIIINPSLTEDELQLIVIETRSIIIKLYLSCEMDYTKGIKLYEQIVETLIKQTLDNQINNLEEKKTELLGFDPSKIVLAEDNLIKENYKDNIEKKKQEIQSLEQKVNNEVLLEKEGSNAILDNSLSLNYTNETV
jgi:hypothetical protein